MKWPIYIGMKFLGIIEAETAAEAFSAAGQQWPAHTASEFTTVSPLSKTEQRRQDRDDEEEAYRVLSAPQSSTWVQRGRRR